jgi:hypothetical protein
MFGFKTKRPVTDIEGAWVDEGFDRLGRMLGADRMLAANVVLPTDEFFPDSFEKTETGLRTLFRRVCHYMWVDPDTLDLEVIPDTSELIEMLPEYHYRASSSDPAGLHFGQSSGDRALVAVKQSLLKDPLSLVATLAHELCHVILLDGGHMSRDTEDMEPMTDLATVFLGMGIFTANSARRFVQFHEDRRQGWSMNRLGYLPEEIFGYALARFAELRNEGQPEWAKYLNTNVSTYYRQSAAWLGKNKNKLN